MELGMKIKNLRTARNMTLEELGKKVGVGKSTVRKWEEGIIANMGVDKVINLAKVLSTTPNYLLGYEDCYVKDDYLHENLLNRVDVKDITETLLQHDRYFVAEVKKYIDYLSFKK